MDWKITTLRRRFLYLTGSLAAGLTLPAVSQLALAAEENGSEGKEAEVNPVEDLMREHGILRRLLLVYEEEIRRLDDERELPPEIIQDSAGIVRRFVKDYHEKLEEKKIFPRFEG